MAEIIYLDLVGGISGDMLLAALLHSGIPMALVEGELAMLPLRGYKIGVEKERRSGLDGLRVSVEVADAGHPHRRHSDIREMISGSGLNAGAKDLALRVFARLAGAEAAVHGTSADEVEFHEIGAVDSIVDIVACSVAISFISPSAVLCSTPVLGTGKSKTAHGEIPLPAPATVELLKGMQARFSSTKGETITPTGAAFLAELATVVRETPPVRINAVGHGWGGRKGPGLNLLRVMRGEQADGAVEGDALLVEANIDDMNPQIYPAVVERLLRLGAMDAWTSPVIMKSGRPGCVLSALIPAGLLSAAAQTILTETTTIGLRYGTVNRVMLSRRMAGVETPYGNITIKVAHYGDTVFNAAPEYSECAAAAMRTGTPVKEVIAAAMEAYRKLGAT